MASKEYGKHFFNVIYLHSVHPLSVEGSKVSYQFFKKGGLTGSQFLEGGCWKRGGGFFEQVDEEIAVFR